MARRVRAQKKIDYTHWTYGSWTFLAQAAGIIAANVIAAQHQPETLLRTRGSLLCGLDGAQAPGGLLGVAFGLIMVPEGTAATALWSPITDGDAPWFYWTGFEVGYEEAVTDVVDMPGMTSYREIIDSKAMRIIRNQELQAVLEIANIGTSTAVNFTGSARFLTGH